MVNAPDFDALLARHQDALVEFLQTDLSIGFTFLESAKLADPGHSQELIGRVHKVLNTVRFFSGRIQNRVVWRQIHERANALEAALEEFH
jgi:hypothetical protein